VPLVDLALVIEAGLGDVKVIDVDVGR